MKYKEAIQQLRTFAIECIEGECLQCDDNRRAINTIDKQNKELSKALRDVISIAKHPSNTTDNISVINNAKKLLKPEK